MEFCVFDFTLSLSFVRNVLKKQIKECPRCGRYFSNRKKWESRGIWKLVVYCSDKCRLLKNKVVR